MKQIPDDFLKKMRTEVDIIEVAEQYFSLAQMGNVYQTSCIHGTDSDPSLTFFPPTNTFFCFGCGAGKKPKTEGSDVISFVMWMDNCSFTEAVLKLANMQGWTVPRNNLSPEGKKQQQALEAAIENNRKYWHHLQEEPEFIKYLNERGIDEDEVNKWRIGAVPSSESYFPNRIAFALMNDWGQTVGFSYRNMSDQFEGIEDGGAKYVNSKKSVIFDKGSVLYGLNFVKKKIRDLGYVVVGEGFGDTILGQKAGLPFVSIMGTSLTDKQIEILKKYTDTVILWLDGDDGGINATLRHSKVLQERGFIVKVINVLGKDPDDIFMEMDVTPEEFIQDNAMLASQFLIDRELSIMDSHINEMKLRAIRKLKPVIENMPKGEEMQVYINHVARRLDVDKEILLED